MKDYLIIGNSAAGISAAREIRRCDPAGRITIVSDEPSFGYSRVLLPLYLAGKLRKKEMFIAPREFYASSRIRLLRSDPAVNIEAKAATVHTRRGKRLAYDSLLVATGASPRTLGVPGENLAGVHSLRQLPDAERIRQGLSAFPGPVVLAGGGLVALKSLEALVITKRQGHLVVSADRVLSRMLDKTASDLFLDSFRKKGVTVHLQTGIRSFEGNGRLSAAVLSDGSFLPCVLAIVGKGVRPNVELFQGTGVTLNQGVKVDAHMATGLAGVYAAGDVAEPLNPQGAGGGNAIWPLAVEGGRVAGANMASQGSVPLSPVVRMNVVEILGLRAVSAGNWRGEKELTYVPRGASVYRKLAFTGNRLSGFLLAGDTRGAGVLTSLLKTGTEIPVSVLEQGLERGFSFRPRLQALNGEIQIRGPVKMG